MNLMYKGRDKHFCTVLKNLECQQYLDSWRLQPTYSCKILRILQRE